jgi:hypothetical protein
MLFLKQTYKYEMHKWLIEKPILHQHRPMRLHNCCIHKHEENNGTAVGKISQ